MGVRVVLFSLAFQVIDGIALGMYIAYKIHEHERERERERENQYGRNRSSYASSGRNADGNNEECGICLVKMTDCFQFNCGHKFHKECVIELLIHERRTCPMCRAGISPQRCRRA